MFAYLDCGRLHGGFARIRCPKCLAEHLLAFSCRTRGLCGSCQAKRSAVFAEWLVEDVLLDVPHRHVVFTIPKALRGLIERERKLHGLMAKAAWETLCEMLAKAACESGGVPGVVASLQTFGSYGASFHPHLHAIRDRPDGKVELDTPPDPKTGARVKVLDRLDFIHAVCQQIPDAKLHQVRYYGAYSCKKRRFLREARATLGGEGPTQKDEVEAETLLVPPTDAPPSATPGSAEARRRQSWARMLKKVFEVDPLVCKRCGEEMEIVAWITKVDVIDRILRHRREKGLVSPFEP